MFSYFKINLFLCLHLLIFSERLLRACFGSGRMMVSLSAMQRLKFFAAPRRGSVRVTTSQSMVDFTIDSESHLARNRLLRFLNKKLIKI